MGGMNWLMRRLAIIVAIGGVVAAPAWGQRQSLTMLDHIDAGRWELRIREPGMRPESLCLSDARRLIQLRHREGNCDRVIVQDKATEVTVQYTCRGRGYGLTHIRRETSRLMQIQTQGIADGLPFEFSAEARRIGSCAT